MHRKSSIYTALLFAGMALFASSCMTLSGSAPAERAIEADLYKSKVLSVRNIMITPSSLVKLSDGLDHALRVMRRSELSSVYVVDGKMKLSGILTLSDAMRAKKEALALSEVLIRDVTTTTTDVLVEDIMPLAAEAFYPLAVVDDDQRLLGIVTKASVLSSLI